MSKRMAVSIISLIALILIFLILAARQDAQAEWDGEPQIAIETNETEEITEETDGKNIVKIIVEYWVVKMPIKVGTTPPVPELEPAYTEEDVKLCAQLLYAECRGVVSKAQQAAVLWVAVNRMYSSRWPDTLAGVIKAKGQFAWRGWEPIWPELEELARLVLDGMTLELAGYSNPWRTIPEDYYFFAGNGKENRFRHEYLNPKREFWDWSLPDPFGKEG